MKNDAIVVTAGIIARTFGMDPLVVIDSDDVDLAIRMAAAQAVQEAEAKAQKEGS